MSYQVKQGDIFGRVGQGFGQGLGAQLPKEVERERLSSGLRDLANQQNLNPMERLAALYGTPGVADRPELVRSATQYMQQLNQADALRQQANIQAQPRQFPGVNPQQTSQSSDVPSLTKADVFEKTQEGYIPPTQQEITSRAAQAYNDNPGFFNNDPQKAMDYVHQEESQKEKIALANQTKHANLSKIQDNVVARLKQQSENLGAKIPADLYSTIEDEAIQATKPIKDGGRGLDEQQAMKEYGKKMDDASRVFSQLSTVGNWGITTRSAKNTMDQINSLQNQMEKLGQTDNMALNLIADSGFSPRMAFSMAQPVYKVPELNSFLKGLPDLEPTETLFETVQNPDSLLETMKIAPKLGKIVQDNPKASPLAIARELELKGYDGQLIINYLSDNRQELNLRQRQIDQLGYPKDSVGTYNDWWVQAFSGIK